MRTLLFLILTLLSSWFSLAANLYNYQDSEIQNLLKSINSDYGINTDVHVLDSWDTCADRQDYAACVRETADDGVELIYTINLNRREMETSINTTLSPILPDEQALRLEELAVDGLRNNDTSTAIKAYLAWLTNYLEAECETYWASDCTETSLTKAKMLYEEAQKEDRARETVKLLWIAVTLLALWILLITWWKRWTRRQRDKWNRTLLNQLIDHSKFLGMTIKHDTFLSDSDKRSLNKNLAPFEEDLESLSTSAPDWIHLKLSEEKYDDKLDALTDRYQKMLELIWDSDEIVAQVKKIKGMDI